MKWKEYSYNFALLVIVTVTTLTSCTGASATTNPGPMPTAEFSAFDAANALSACTYYVAPAGSDDASGTESEPWATLERAVEAAQPGDVVCVRGGTYVIDTIHLTRSGTAEAPITFTGYSGEVPILDGGGETGELLILSRGTSFVRISGFYLRNFTVWGMELSGENRYIQLDHLEVEGGEAAIHFTYGETEAPPVEGPVDYITLEDSVIHGSQYSAVDCTPGPCNHMVIRRVEIFGTGLEGEAFYGSDGLEFARGYPVLVEDCYVHDNGGDGIDLNSRDREGHAVDVVVRRNRVVRNHLNGIKLWGGGRMENNLVWGQGNSAVWVGTYHSTVEIVNNTIAYNMWDPDYSERNWALVVGYPEEIQPYPQVALTLVNNLIAFNTGPDVGDPTGIYLGGGVQLIEHHNLYYSSENGEITAEFLSGRDIDVTREEVANGIWSELTGQGQADLTQDPLFLSGWPAADFQLTTGSPAVNAGAALEAPADDLYSRPRDSQPDIGAYERQAPAAVRICVPLLLRRSLEQLPEREHSIKEAEVLAKN